MLLEVHLQWNILCNLNSSKFSNFKLWMNKRPYMPTLLTDIIIITL